MLQRSRSFLRIFKCDGGELISNISGLVSKNDKELEMIRDK